MIISAFLNLAYFFITGAIALLPDISILPDSFETAIDSFLSIIAQWQSVIPVFDDLLVIVLLMLTVETSILTLYAINWVIKKIPFIG